MTINSMIHVYNLSFNFTPCTVRECVGWGAFMFWNIFCLCRIHISYIYIINNSICSILQPVWSRLQFTVPISRISLVLKSFYKGFWIVYFLSTVANCFLWRFIRDFVHVDLMTHDNTTNYIWISIKIYIRLI